jgi:prolyl-tRNA synthetase
MQAVAASVNRYSTEVDVSERPRSKNRLIEVPHFVTVGNVGAESFRVAAVQRRSEKPQWVNWFQMKAFASI